MRRSEINKVIDNGIAKNNKINSSEMQFNTTIQIHIIPAEIKMCRSHTKATYKNNDGNEEERNHNHLHCEVQNICFVLLVKLKNSRLALAKIRGEMGRIAPHIYSHISIALSDMDCTLPSFSVNFSN